MPFDAMHLNNIQANVALVTL